MAATAQERQRVIIEGIAAVRVVVFARLVVVVVVVVVCQGL